MQTPAELIAKARGSSAADLIAQARGGIDPDLIAAARAGQEPPKGEFQRDPMTLSEQPEGAAREEMQGIIDEIGPRALSLAINPVSGAMEGAATGLDFINARTKGLTFDAARGEAGMPELGKRFTPEEGLGPQIRAAAPEAVDAGMVGKVAHGIGSSLAMLPMGIAGGIPGVVFGSIVIESGAEYEAHLAKKPGDEAGALRAAAIAAPVAALEGVTGMGAALKIFGRINKASKGGLWKALQKHGAAATFGNYGQESLQQGASEINAHLRDEDIGPAKEWLGRMNEAGVVGFFVGGVMGGAAAMLRVAVDEQPDAESLAAKDKPGKDDQAAPEPTGARGFLLPEEERISEGGRAAVDAVAPAAVEEVPPEPAAPEEEIPPPAAPALLPEPAKGADPAAEPAPTPSPELPPTSIKNETVDRELAEMGLPPATHAEKTTFEEANEAAAKVLEDDPLAGARLAKELAETPRALDGAETALLTRHRNSLRLERVWLEDRIIEAGEAQDEELLAKLEKRAVALQDEFARASDAVTLSGTKTAQGLALRRMELKEDYSLAAMERKKRVANRGAVLTEEQSAELRDQHKRLGEAIKRFDESLRTLSDRVADKKLPATARKRTRNRVTRFTSDQADKARARIKERGVRMYAGIDTAELVDEIIIAADYLARGVVDVAAWGKAMATEFGEGIRPHLDNLYGLAASQLEEARTEAAEASLEASIARYEKKIAASDTSPMNKKGKPVRETPKMKRLMARRDSVKKQLAELRSSETPQEVKDERALKAYKTRKKNQVRDILSRTKAKDFKPSPRREVPLDQEAIALKAEVEIAKREFTKSLEADRRANRTRSQKALGLAREIAIDVPRAVLSSGDLSAMGRQGLFFLYSRPLLSITKAMPAMLRALRSDRLHMEADTALRSRPTFLMWTAAKLEHTELDGELSLREEEYRSDLAERIPVLGKIIRASNRAFVTYLNTIRAYAADALSESTFDGNPTSQQAADIADFVNNATGRGTGAIAQKASALSALLWAPKLLISRFKMIIGPLTGFLYGVKTRDALVRKMLAKEYVRFLMGAGVVYALASLLRPDVERDPKSSDFLKIRFGNTRIDPMGGLIQTTVFLWRLVPGSGVKTLKTGDIRPAKVSDIGRFLRYKLSPSLGTAINLRFGTNAIGEPMDASPEGLKNIAKGTVVPLAWQDIAESIREQGVPAGAAMSMLAIFGFGLQTFDPSAKKKK